MNKGRHQIEIIYALKPGTSTSYYFQSGQDCTLPRRICITRKEFAPINGMVKYSVGQLKATFTKGESSTYKVGHGVIHSTIYQLKNPVSGIIGTGDLRGTRDLLIFRDGEKAGEISISIYPGGLYHEAEIIQELMMKPQS